jgi:two-component system, cell cycle response regulator DivK
MITPVRHALVIDGSVSNTDVLTALLGLEGIGVWSFLHPDEAERALERLPAVDVVFCELELPDTSGYELLPRLRRHFGHDVPIIAYTVYTSQMGRARQAGFDGFLGKPVDGERFAEVLARILRGEQVWSAS